MVRLSYSKISDFEMCPRKYYYGYIAKIEGEPNKYLIIGRDIHDILYKSTMEDDPVQYVLAHPKYDEYEDMVNNYVLLLESMKKAGANVIPNKAEIKFHDTVFDFSGIIDRIDKHNGRILISDYKSDNRVNRSKHDRQLLLYSFFYERIYKETPTHIGAFFLRHDNNIKAKEIDREAQSEAVKWLYKTKKEIERKGTDITNYESRPQFLCKYCSFGEIGICKEGKEFLERGFSSIPSVEMDNEIEFG
jgi:CRISPR/Cas system-associated exonuclease Cas4 (RecB family)